MNFRWDWERLTYMVQLTYWEPGATMALRYRIIGEQLGKSKLRLGSNIERLGESLLSAWFPFLDFPTFFSLQFRSLSSALKNINTCASVTALPTSSSHSQQSTISTDLRTRLWCVSSICLAWEHQNTPPCPHISSTFIERGIYAVNEVSSFTLCRPAAEFSFQWEPCRGPDES